MLKQYFAIPNIYLFLIKLLVTRFKLWCSHCYFNDLYANIKSISDEMELNLFAKISMTLFTIYSHITIHESK